MQFNSIYIVMFSNKIALNDAKELRKGYNIPCLFGNSSHWIYTIHSGAENVAKRISSALPSFYRVRGIETWL